MSALEESMFGFFKKNNTQSSIDKFWSEARGASIESVFKEGKYISFLIFPVDPSIFSDKKTITSEGISVFVRIIEERISADDFDPVLPSNIGGIPINGDKGKSMAKRHVLLKKEDGKTVRPLFDWSL
ncbi:hypothetical protein HUS70_12455 [Pandoraea nosoerga]|uniref:hypothetical protein n=1 Tax=Pandoraea nosoerga TaxID=2508296 RepID=UPI00197D57B0|nr:hypothetical protein [Pandoraea nosoerga]MBN4666268.1 hypothetical protein [Pandoraea nosoerga]MBN4676323.1 hypothetical protein [Pandoraea nosoerga]MBN4681360.1 hypothetical protein [Pandoraea nosoerga]MBN4745434.1 hypothetical protein [Pandoraea nosoerga]